ncbi:hypothetical protein CC85DRAFT_284709 [Cutaneotrichosporon oleaginosum]|uniref:Signal recognition particle subunit SRP72 n=1 Tax=Cutaneotrichosporon oleaginosum TaxID=879819 RepID=A0A0J0XQF7_9TREE|nr:uncharacterized protein CC85DRAFT_284709 [Cutaneotrichosporon oleaginosum]KLT43356.1 hypothetical protein CC85DRAFT_284709 [Cutaneotrichosporon oleaginosum]TXT14384.1 hypothetical protein COLE_00577 [Cutaneotrichosporon oleaginosum]
MPPKKQQKAPARPAAPTKGEIKIVDGKRKFTPRPPLPAAQRLPRLYRALTDQVNDGFFDNAKKTCKRILALDPASTSAFQTLLFLHLHTDDYAAALDLVEHPPSPADLRFERAYCLYRLHRERDALAQLQDIETRTRREEHLEAQVRYRLGEFEAAQALYDALLPSAAAEADDIRTNQAAARTQLAFITREYATHLPAGEAGVPSVPSARVSAPAAAASASASMAAAASAKPKKRRHRLPKGAEEGKPYTEDAERWLPMRQRASYVPPGGKKKKEVTGLGTQGATGGGGGGGGQSKKKGKKK